MLSNEKWWEAEVSKYGRQYNRSRHSVRKGAHRSCEGKYRSQKSSSDVTGRKLKDLKAHTTFGGCLIQTNLDKEKSRLAVI